MNIADIASSLDVSMLFRPGTVLCKKELMDSLKTLQMTHSL